MSQHHHHVNILVTLTTEKHFEVQTLVFDTLRVGFPNAHVRVDINNSKNTDAFLLDKLRSRIRRAHVDQTTEWPNMLHHAAWIQMCIESHEAPGPLILLDSDVIFWKSCEDWSFDTHLAGFYVPTIWNEWAQCISFERLHTSFLWITKARQMLETIRATYPFSQMAKGEYCPLNVYYPDVKYVRGKPMFWDCMAGAYNMLGGTAFTEKELTCYDHINSASFYDEMLERVEDKEAFRNMHEVAKKEPMKMRGFYKAVQTYYEKMAKKAVELEKGAVVETPS